MDWISADNKTGSGFEMTRGGIVECGSLWFFLDVVNHSKHITVTKICMGFNTFFRRDRVTTMA